MKEWFGAHWPMLLFAFITGIWSVKWLGTLGSAVFAGGWALCLRKVSGNYPFGDLTVPLPSAVSMFRSAFQKERKDRNGS